MLIGNHWSFQMKHRFACMNVWYLTKEVKRRAQGMEEHGTNRSKSWITVWEKLRSV